MQCVNSKCHLHRSDDTCSAPEFFTDRPCYERIFSPEPQSEEESEE